MTNPVSTYRIQFHKEFTFADFEKIIPYLVKLGVKTVYASPVFKSTPGSTHGYDALDPHCINPEIGSEEQLKQISSSLKSAGLGWLQDIVPNHMAFGPDNRWLMDVLEKGPQSVYAPFFDTALTSELYRGRMMVPFLGSDLKEVTEKKELKIEYRDGRFVFNYFDACYPLGPRSYERILSKEGEEASEAQKQILSQMQQIHQADDPQMYTDRWNEFLLQLSSLMKNSEEEQRIKAELDRINSDPALLLEIAEEQVYRLCSWQETDHQITFRRFFTVNGLICLNIQNQEVFSHFHRYIKSLTDEGIFNGLRVDHIDGLFDPSAYLTQLRETAGEEAYIVVEKILEPGEELPSQWPIQGNTGYDFLSIVNNLFTYSKSRRQFTGLYNSIAGDMASVEEQIYEKKAYILYQHMAGELDNLYRLLLDSDLLDSEDTLVKNDDLKTAIGEFLIQCPVYRYYGNSFPLKKEETEALKTIFKRIVAKKPELGDATRTLKKVLIKNPLIKDGEYNRRALYFFQRCMQFSGPLMAKGVEDTLMYTYNRFIGHNEVGDSPEAFGMSAGDFHTAMKTRQESWPLSLNATSTHDTKRGEDVRARLNVITELPEEWTKVVNGWIEQNRDLKQSGRPDSNDEYLIYQTLLGSAPMPGQEDENYPERVQEYLTKALREAKQHSNWTEPDEQYEEAAKAFALKLLDSNSAFRKTFDALHKKVADFGIINSLSQTVLKFTCPGVPDVYQGCDLWDLSMVDPDNRRPVDYSVRAQLLEGIESYSGNATELISGLWQNRYNGQIKLWLTHLLLNERKSSAELFEKGSYIPLKVKGKHKEHVLAFARRHQQNLYIIAVPLHLALLCNDQQTALDNISWKNTRIVLPDGTPEHWEHLFVKGLKGKAEKEIAVKELFGTIPVAVLKLQQPANDRGAGILMHISSLPSPFGIGDFGPGAKEFAQFLSRSRQKFWQLLPLSPTEQSCGNSPYSSYSSMAGNPLLISPELLVDAGLLKAKQTEKYRLPDTAKTDYAAAEHIKDILFEKAFRNFQKGDFEKLKEEFAAFCQKESDWLNDFSLYVVLKQQHAGQAWYQWPDQYKLRDNSALQDFTARHADAIEKTKWLQFIFSQQWHELKNLCNGLGIQMFGDLPFYVSYDSADVWANPGIFNVDKKGNIKGVAGVPPDYFNENGQLWGMPVFRWDVLKKQDYKWWEQRIRKNIELFDLLRFDHFRAFSAYWEVPAEEETAKNGTWKPGPGKEFFEVIRQKLGRLPFVAEDLGDIDQPVYDLRDSFAFPGMKVLQFAFGEDMPHALGIPHGYTANFFVYTGTHDNNTTRGWFRKDADELIKKNLKAYTGLEVKSKNIHLILARMAYASVAKTAILPLQDILGLDEKARMNSPASAENNWLWRLKPGQLTSREEEMLSEWVKTYGRE